MKGFRGTLFFAILVAIVAGLALWQYKKAPPEDAEKPPGELLFQAGKTGDIQELNFVSSTRKFKLKKEAGVWNIVEPFKDEADAAEVSKSISDIFNLRATILDTGGGPIQWEKYGLTDPDETITLKDNKDQSIQLKVGRVRTYDKGFYLRRGDEEKLIVASTTLMATYDLTANSLRNKKMTIPGTKALSVSINSRFKGSESHYTVKFDNGQWIVEGHKVKLSTKLVQKMIENIRDLKAEAFAVNDKNSADEAAQVKKLGLKNPIASVKIVFENPEGNDKPNVTREIAFGQESGKGANENDVFYMSDVNIAVYKTSKNTATALLKSLDSLRDPKGPFTFDSQKVTSIKFTSPDFKTGLVIQKRKNKDGKAAWQVVGGAKKAEQKVNEPVVMDFISNINVLEAMQFFKPNEKKLKPDYSAELKDEAGSTLIKIEFGSIFKDAKSGLETYLVKSSLADNLVSVRKASIDKLTKPNLVQNASAPARVTETKKVEQAPREN